MRRLYPYHAVRGACLRKANQRTCGFHGLVSTPPHRSQLFIRTQHTDRDRVLALDASRRHTDRPSCIVRNARLISHRRLLVHAFRRVKLLVIELCIQTAAREQLGMTAHLDDAAGVEDGGVTVGDHDRGAALEETRERLLDAPLRARVERRGRLVEQEYLRIFEKGPREGEALLLPAGQHDTTNTEHKPKTHEQNNDELL